MNGIDYEEWNPQTDKHLVSAFNSTDTKGKAENKAFLQRHFGLPVDEDVMMKNPAAAAKLMRKVGIPAKYRQARTSGLATEIKYRELNQVEINIQRD